MPQKYWSISSSASLSNPFVASPTSQIILLPFRCFTYVTWRAVHETSTNTHRERVPTEENFVNNNEKWRGRRSWGVMIGIVGVRYVPRHYVTNHLSSMYYHNTCSFQNQGTKKKAKDANLQHVSSVTTLRLARTLRNKIHNSNCFIYIHIYKGRFLVWLQISAVNIQSVPRRWQQFGLLL